jgi:hypothetical protein
MPRMFKAASHQYEPPIVKGEEKMSKKKTAENGSWPMPPMWGEFEWNWQGWDGEAEKAKDQVKGKAGELAADMKSFWEKGIDLQKSSIDRSKDQYDQFFTYIQDMMDDFVESLPEELPGMPPCPITPKDFRKSMKEWEEMINDYFKEQAGSWTDFAIKSQEKACEQIPEKKEDDAEVVEVEAEVEDAAAEKPKTTRQTRQTKAAK